MPFPAAPQTQQLFFRDDLDLECYYDGTRWLTTRLYEATITARSTMPQAVAQASELAGSVTYSRYLVGVVLTTNVQTTNTGSNYWTIALRDGVTGAALGTTLNTSAHSPGTWNTQSFTITNALPGTTLIQLLSGLVGSPGVIFFSGLARYRYIIT